MEKHVQMMGSKLSFCERRPLESWICTDAKYVGVLQIGCRMDMKPIKSDRIFWATVVWTLCELVSLKIDIH